MKRGQVFVRAKDPNGKWCNADVLDLTEDSFRAFVIQTLFHAQLVSGLKDEFVGGEHIEYRTRIDSE